MQIQQKASTADTGITTLVVKMSQEITCNGASLLSGIIHRQVSKLSAYES
jgi:hypothetical protein